MRILLVGATDAEIAALRLLAEKRIWKNLSIDFMVTGVGMAPTAFALGKKISAGKYDLCINSGVAGSFRNDIIKGEVVAVLTDLFGDLGAENDEEFLTLYDLGLCDRDHFPYWNGKIKCSYLELFTTTRQMRKVKAITVNTAHGNDKRIRRTVRLFSPDIETMEGAAFSYSCSIERIPFVQIRAISNKVEKRNRDAWNLPLAIKQLGNSVSDLLTELNEMRNIPL